MTKNDAEINRLLNNTTEYLNEVEYPAHKHDLVAAAEARNAPAQVLRVLDLLPAKVYASHNDLIALFIDSDGEPTRGFEELRGL